MNQSRYEQVSLTGAASSAARVVGRRLGGESLRRRPSGVMWAPRPPAAVPRAGLSVNLFLCIWSGYLSRSGSLESAGESMGAAGQRRFPPCASHLVCGAPAARSNESVEGTDVRLVSSLHGALLLVSCSRIPGQPSTLRGASQRRPDRSPRQFLVLFSLVTVSLEFREARQGDPGRQSVTLPRLSVRI